MALIERQYILNLVVPRENYDRRVREADPEVAMALDDRQRFSNVRCREQLELIRAALNLAEQTRARCLPDPGGEQVVEFCEHER